MSTPTDTTTPELTAVAPKATKVSENAFLFTGLPAATPQGYTVNVECVRVLKKDSSEILHNLRFTWDDKLRRLRIDDVVKGSKLHIISGLDYDIRNVQGSSITYIKYGADGYVCEMNGHIYDGNVATNEIVGFKLVSVSVKLSGDQPSGQ